MIDIIVDIIPRSNNNRPGIAMQPKYITIHNTDNYDVGAGAKAHASFIRNTTDKTSWHYTVDDKYIIQHLPITETAYHAGDGSGPGNRQSIGIEICVNSDGDFEQAKRNAAWLVAKLFRESQTLFDFSVAMRQHFDWSGKNCPAEIRSEPDGWNKFLNLCKEAMIIVPEWMQKIMDDAVKFGLIEPNKHKPTDPAQKWFILGVALIIVKKLNLKGLW